MFDKVANHYDLIMSAFDYQELTDYLDDLIISYDGDRTTLLDIACGTAEELVYFRQLGYKTEGLDLSAEMLAEAEKKHPGVNFYNQDMTNFKTGKKYDNIICTFDSVNYILNEDKLQGTFNCCCNHLNDKGLLLLILIHFTQC